MTHLNASSRASTSMHTMGRDGATCAHPTSTWQTSMQCADKGNHGWWPGKPCGAANGAHGYDNGAVAWKCQLSCWRESARPHRPAHHGAVMTEAHTSSCFGLVCEVMLTHTYHMRRIGDLAVPAGAWRVGPGLLHLLPPLALVLGAAASSA